MLRMTNKTTMSYQMLKDKGWTDQVIVHNAYADVWDSKKQEWSNDFELVSDNEFLQPEIAPEAPSSAPTQGKCTTCGEPSNSGFTVSACDKCNGIQPATGKCTTCDKCSLFYATKDHDVCPECGHCSAPAVPSLVGADMAFIDSDGVYQECTVRSVLDGYAWVQKIGGKLNTVPVVKLINRKSERDLFVEGVVNLTTKTRKIITIETVRKTAEVLYDAGYRKITPAPVWPESDERISNIGQNGNNGEHYDE